MEIVGFIGGHTKLDLMLYVAKVLTATGRRVLVVDNTKLQRARYIVPAINPAKTYVTNFENIDVAVGLSSFEEIKENLDISQNFELQYDFCLIDIDSNENFENFNMYQAKKNYFVTSFDLYSLKTGLEILNNLLQTINVTKILYSKDMSKEENEYLNYLALETKANWNQDYYFYIPIDNGDESTIIDNQRVSRLSIKRLSSQFKDSLFFIALDILGENEESNLKKSFKILEKGV